MKQFIRIMSLIISGLSIVSCAVMEPEENLAEPTVGNKARTALTKGGMEQLDSLGYVYKYQSNLNNLLYKTIHRNKDGVIVLGLSKADAKSLGISEDLYESVNKAAEEKNKQ